MEDQLKFFTDFLSVMKNDVLNYYRRSHLYLKDLVSYKNINLKLITSTETAEVYEVTLIKMLKAIKTGLNTLGVPISKLTEIQNSYLNEMNKRSSEGYDYNYCLQQYLNEYVNMILFEILIEYVLDLDTKKIEALVLFKLVPPSFVDKLDRFRKQNKYSDNRKEYISLSSIEEYLNISDLSITVDATKKNPNKINNSIMNEERDSRKTEKKEDDELDILKKLEEAKKDSIETLKTPKTEVFKPSIEQMDKTNIKNEYQEFTEDFTQVSSIIEKKYSTQEKTEIFLDNLGSLPTLDQEIINRFKINTVNLLNSRVVNPDFLDLESLFYYISILKMLGIEFPFNSIEILEILKNYISKMVFSYSKYDTSDPVYVFYGLAIITELDLVHRTNIINLQAIEEFLMEGFKRFIPEKLKLNYYTLLSLKMLERNEIISSNKDGFLAQVLGLNLLNLKGFNPTLDIYNHIASIKILDRNIDLSKFTSPYMNELKKILTKNGAIDDLITESARTLLIINLLNLKNQESVMCSRLLNFIITSTSFFSLENINKDFNWRIDKLAYKIELRMLFWALLACTQYSSSDFINR
ncbi:MAG: hypothetical protein ACW98D_08475 [Promethearchaeota archaeon]|jgi:hypothetical protein